MANETATTWKAQSWNNVGNDPNLREDGKQVCKAGITPVAGGTEMFSNVIYIQPALAAPTPQAGVNPADLGFVTGKAAYEITPDVFQTGDNTNFYLLDQDENGNFLIMDDYQSGIGNSIDKTRSMDPSDPNNKLAYWLNNGFFWNLRKVMAGTETATTGRPLKRLPGEACPRIWWTM